MATPVLDLTFKSATALAANRIVVRNGSNEAALPGATNARRVILGATLQSCAAAGRGVPVRREGIAEVAASAAIDAGAQVVISGTDGRIREVAMPSIDILSGTGGAYLTMTAKHLEPALQGFKANFGAEGNNASFAAAYMPGVLSVDLATGGGGAVTTTLTALKTALETAVGSLFEFTITGSGSAVVTEANYVFSTFATEGPIIGIAQESGAAAGSLVPVMLTI